MPYKLFYYDEVKTDVQEAKKWYKSKLDGLEKRFAAEIKEAITHIQQYPLHFQIRYNTIRVAYTHIFPYGIHYFIDEPNHSIVIIAILSTHQHPTIPQERI